MKGGFLTWLAVLVFYPIFAQTMLPDSLERFSKLPKDTSYVNSLNKLANDYIRNNPVASRQIATHVSEVANEIEYIRGYARSLTVIGNSYWSEGVFEFAQNYYFLAARQYQIANDSVGLGQTYNNMGEVYKRLGEYGNALQYLLASLDLKKNDVATKAITLYNIGEIYYLLKDYKKAEQYYENSISIAIKENNRRVIAYNYNGFGLLRLKEQQYEKALEYFARAEKLWKELGDLRSLIQTYQHLSDACRMMGLFEKAERYLILANEMSSIIKVPDLQIVNYRKLSQLDSVKGNYVGALKNLYMHNTLKDSVYSISKAEQIARLQMIYETDVRETENKQLRYEKDLRDAKLRLQRNIITGISVGLLLVGIMAWVFYIQRRKILSVNKILNEKTEEIQTQKLAIELQATALIKLNEELQYLNKSLESRIDERTEQLTIQNQKLTEYTFLNAHKLRAPVSSILGLINLMNQTDSKEKEIIYGHLKSCGEQLDMITRQISRNLESGIFDEVSNDQRN